MSRYLGGSLPEINLDVKTLPRVPAIDPPTGAGMSETARMLSFETITVEHSVRRDWTHQDIENGETR